MKTKVTLTLQERLDVLTNAIESNGIQYWACEHGLISIKRDADLNITQAKFKADNDKGETKEYTVTPALIQKGVDAIFSEGFEVGDFIKKQIVADDRDALTDDVIIQAGIFGEIVYG